jgi:uncharacterized protein
MEIILLPIAAFFVSILTFFSGFGLGTIMSPIFMLYFPVDLAIALTAVVHFVSNIFKLALTGKHIHKEVMLKFGIPAILFALFGSLFLVQLSNIEPLFTYSLFGKVFDVYAIKLIISILLIAFVLFEVHPFFKKLEFGKDKLYLGGALSGFFGGLSGIQGALRSAFLMKAGLTKEEFVSTAIVISTFVDLTRLSIYSAKMPSINWEANATILVSTVSLAILGAFLGNQLLKKITISYIQKLVFVMLLIFACLLGLGIL